jgi:hypothetical protein
MANRWNTLLVLGWDMKQLLFESIGGGGAIFLYRVGGNIFWKVTFQICFNVWGGGIFLYITTRDTLVTPLHHVEKSIF